MLRIPALALVALIAACQAADDKTLYFSAIPDQNNTELAEKFGKVADYLSAELGVPVVYRPARDYGASVEMFKNGDIQLAWFGGLTGVQARQAIPGARAIAQGRADPKYYSYFIAHRDAGLDRSDAFPTKIADMKFSFGSRKSTSGRLMPEFFIRQNTGKGPDEFFNKQYTFSKSHDMTAELVESGQVQAGVLNYRVYEKRVESGKTDPAVCKIIWKTPFYADYNFTAHPDLETMFGAGFTEKLQKALIGMKDKELLDAFPREALIPAKNEDFDGIVGVAEELDMLR
jgi:phosphonate transport system substrate-binding protein